MTMSGRIANKKRLAVSGKLSPTLNATPVFDTCTMRSMPSKKDEPIVNGGIVLTTIYLVGGNDDERQHERPQSFRLRSIIHSSASISIKHTIGYRAVLGLGCHGNDMNWQVESFVTFLQNSHYQCL